eukprot:5832879-Lingulodinium_polyedra.AAC.1
MSCPGPGRSSPGCWGQQTAPSSTPCCVTLPGTEEGCNWWVTLSGSRTPGHCSLLTPSFPARAPACPCAGGTGGAS